MLLIVKLGHYTPMHSSLKIAYFEQGLWRHLIRYSKFSSLIWSTSPTCKLTF